MNTQKLLLFLPTDKFLAWSQDLRETIASKVILLQDLDSMVGQLNHAAYVIPLSRHFLARLRSCHGNRIRKRQQITLSFQELEDLKLWIKFLKQSNDRISMNLLTLQTPSKKAVSDSCPFGMGGFTWDSTAWRLLIPEESPIYGVSVANNVLEFLAMAVTLWLALLDCNHQGLTEECILSLGDNTSAVGWLFRAAPVPSDLPYYCPVQIIARKVATLMTESAHCLWAQHLKGMQIK
mmetsp:Transcript_17988/g.27236  ORF Transcript_17988/g.27236 Transcript_17988/m.27236 type:complete len:236 (-) Transcript_17988:2083-2790(-)